MQRPALLLIGALSACSPTQPAPAPDAAPDLPTAPAAPAPTQPPHDERAVIESLLESPPEPAPTPDGPAVRILGHDDQPIAASIRASAAGIYPPVNADLASGQLWPLPTNHAQLIGGGKPTLYTLLVTSADHAQAAWIDASPDAGEPGAPARYTVKLAPALQLGVKVLRPDGAPQPGAVVTLQRTRVDLVRVQATTSATGIARLGALPPGDYHVTVRAPGATIAASTIHHAAGQTPTIELASARTIAGVVLDPAGRPVRDAVITAHLDQWGTPAALDVRDLDRVRKLPTRAWADAGPDGAFLIEQLPAGVIYLTASAPGFVPRLSQPLDLRDALSTTGLTLTLTPGRTLHILVAAADSTAAPQADVTWTDTSGASGHAMTDAEGKVTLDGLPATARVAAALDRWIAAPTPLPAADQLTLTLKPPGERQDLKLRLKNIPDKAKITSVEAILRDSTACAGERVLKTQGEDWRLVQCAPGEATLRVRTAGHGELELPVTLSDALEVALPPLTPVTLSVTLDETAATPWLSMPSIQPGPVLTRDARQQRRWEWTGGLYPGAYPLRISADGAGHEAIAPTLRVGAAGQPTRADYTLRALRALSALVVDPRGKPVAGAHIEVWQDGALLAEATSEGAAPTLLRATQGAELRAFAFTPRDGEGSARVTDAGRVLITLDPRPQSARDLPNRITDRAALSKQLGAPILEDSGGWRIDVTDAASPAARAHIPRGAYLLHATRTPDGLSLLICDTEAAPPRRVAVSKAP
jgi:hypothetical protein